jgi:hypothetical protein
LLVGSVPLSNAAEVFETVGTRLGDLIPHIPDGETGERINFIAFQDAVMRSTPGLERRGDWLIAGKPSLLYGLAEGVAASDVHFGPLGYAKAAIDSYADFIRARDAGKIAPGTRFQVSMPTPLTVLIKYAAREALHTLWPVYERALLSELDAIARSVPHTDLAIQWDVAPEVHTVLEQPDLDVSRLIETDQMIAALARIIDAVPADVQVGCHFCYGDRGHKHIIEPKDMTILVSIANATAAAAHRLVNWMHMPVPRGRIDAEYFAPLADLNIPRATTLFLGLVHAHDGIDGARLRIAQAARVRSGFGIATECGLGRRPPESIPSLLDLHREIAATL